MIGSDCESPNPRGILAQLFSLVGPTKGITFMRYIQQAFLVTKDELAVATQCAEEAIFSAAAFANHADVYHDVSSGLHLGHRAIEAGNIIGRYLPVVTYHAKGADQDASVAAKTLVPFLVAFVQADRDWVTEWHAAVPVSLQHGFDALAKDAVRSYMVDPDRFEALEFERDEFAARFALYAALILRPVYCPESCGEVVLYASEVWALVHDDVRPNAGFLCTAQMPFCGSTAAGGQCYAHQSILTLVSQHPIEPGEFVTVMSRNPFASNALLDDHPARLWPLKTCRGVPLTANDDVAEFETGPMTVDRKERLVRRLNADRELALAPHWNERGRIRNAVDYSLAMLEVFCAENNDFDGGPAPHRWWTMVLPRAVVVLLYTISEQAREKGVAPETRARIAAALDKMDYARCLDTMEWPLMLVDLYLHTQGHDYHFEDKVFGRLGNRARELCAAKMGCDPDRLIGRVNGALPPAYHVGPPPARSCIEVAGMQCIK